MFKNSAYMLGSEKQQYRLLIDTDLYAYIMVLAQESAPNEITGMGMITKKVHGYFTDFVLEEVIVPEQLVCPGYSAFKEGAQNKIITDVLERGDDPEKLCFRWHSHGNGAVFFSSIDEEDIADCDSPYVVNLVVNTHCDVIARLDVLEPIRIRNIPVRVVIEPAYDEALVEECRDEVKKCCEVMQKKKNKRPGYTTDLSQSCDTLGHSELEPFGLGYGDKLP